MRRHGGVAGSGDPYLFVTLIWRWVSCGHLCITLHSLPQGSRREIATSSGWHMGDNPVLLSPAEVLEAVAHDHADKGASTSAQDVGAFSTSAQDEGAFRTSAQDEGAFSTSAQPQYEEAQPSGLQ